MTYICKSCNNIYASASSLSNHKRKCTVLKESESVHNLVHTPVHNNDDIKNDICKYCNKELCNRKSRWRHEKVCKMRDISGSELNDLRNTVKELKKEIDELKRTQIRNKAEKQIVNNANQVNMNCGTINNINIIPIGKENIDELLTDEQIKEILKLNAPDSITKSLLLVCVSDNLKGCRNTYISSLEGKHCKVYDEEQNKFVTKQKDEVLDNVMITHVSNVKTLVDIHGKPKKKEIVNEYFDKLDVDKTLQKETKMKMNAIIHDNKENIKPIVDAVNKKALKK